MKKLIFLLIILVVSVKIYTQNVVENLDMFLSKKYIESNDYQYIYLEISIWNKNPFSIYLLKDYDLINFIVEGNEIILHLSSWVDNIDSLKNTSALYHNPTMVEIRERQMVYIPLLLSIPNKNRVSDINSIIKRIVGLKYSLVEYITEDISWAENINEFASNIVNKVNDLEFNYNEYTRKYGNIIISQIRPPEWMMGRWKTDGKTIPNGEIINSTLRYLTVISNDFIEENQFSTNSLINISIHGWLITRSKNNISQSYGINDYRLDINFLNGRKDYYYFYIENKNLIMHHKNHNGLFIHKLEKE